MADRYDPKLSVRPLSERRPAAPADDSDPLVELARIVSGRTTFDPAPAPKAKTVPAANGALSAEPILANDLESELMNDLQASFAAVAPPPKPAPPARPAVPPAAAKPAPVPPKAAPPAAPPPARPAPASAAPAAQPFIPPKVAPPSRPAAAQPAAAPVAKPAAPPASRPAAAPAAAKAPPPPQPKAAPPVSERPARPAAPRGERPALQPAARPADRGDFGSMPLRPTTPAHAEPAASAPQGRWDRSGEAENDGGEPSRFAPPSRARNWFRPKGAAEEAARPAEPPRAASRTSQPAPTPEVDDFDHDMFEDAPPTLAEADEIYQDDLALDDIAHYGDDEAELPPLVDELPDMGHRRTPRGLIAVAAVLIVALVGGAGYVMLRGVPGTAGTPPVIAADPGPTKVAPPDDGTQQTADAQNKLIYDRVDGAAKPAEDATNLVTPGTEKIADVNKPADGDDANPVSRVIMQGGPAYDGSAGEDGAYGANAPAKVPGGDEGAAPAAGGDSGLGPRKVRTVVVRPDGTIVSSEAAPADGAATPAGGPAMPDPNKPPSEVAGSLNVPQAGTSMDTVLDKGGNIPVNADPLGDGSGSASADGGATPAPAGTVPASDDAGAAAAEKAQPAQVATADDGDSDGDAAAAAEPAAAPEPPAKPAAPPKPKTVVAKGDPIDLTPGRKAAPAAAPADAAAITGGLSVQVTSQRSEQAALSAYRGLQSRYAQVLGRYQPNVQRADLGDRGTYYRVRVGPFAGDGASRVCAALKAAGGDCIIVK